MNVHVKLLLIAVALSGTLSAAAQVHAIPFMWVSAGVDTVARMKFTKGGYPGRSSRSKAQVFNSAVAGTHPAGYVYPVAAIDKLIGLVQADNQNNTPKGTGIRVHFAAFHAASMPAGFQMGGEKDKQVVLIFSGSTGATSADVPTYYVISLSDNQPHKIPAEVMKDWCAYYNSNVNNANGLASTLEPGHKSENQLNGADFDTRSIFYSMDHFTEYLQVERRYQDTCKSCNPTGAKIDGIGVYFAAHPNKGIGRSPHGEDPVAYKNRLLVLWEFMRGKRVFFIDKAPGFCNRPPGNQCGQPLVIQASFGRSWWGGGDNGQLCPPNCPCIGLDCP